MADPITILEQHIRLRPGVPVPFEWVVALGPDPEAGFAAAWRASADDGAKAVIAASAEIHATGAMRGIVRVLLPFAEALPRPRERAWIRSAVAWLKQYVRGKADSERGRALRAYTGDPDADGVTSAAFDALWDLVATAVDGEVVGASGLGIDDAIEALETGLGGNRYPTLRDPDLAAALDALAPTLARVVLLAEARP